MQYLPPKTTRKSLTVNTQTFSSDYYNAPTLLTGVTDEAHAEYVLANTYTVGTYVKIDALKKYYRAATAIAANEHPCLHPDKWIDYGPLNSYRMLATDEFVNGVTSGTNIVMEYTFNRCDSFAFVAADFIDVTIELFNTADGGNVNVFTKNYIGRDYGALNYSEYYYTDYKTRSRVVVTGLPWLPSSKLRLTFNSTASIGAFVYGNVSDIGLTMYGTALKFDDTSRISESAITGVRSVLRYGSVRIVEAKISIDAVDFNIVANKIEAIIGRNVLWIPTAVDKFTETVSIGYIENITLPIANEVNIQTSTTIIGVL